MAETASSSTETLFYDGDCGVCHWAVKFVARRDPDGRAFRFAPLEGSTSLELLGERRDLPDSIVVLAESGRLLLRSSALIHVLMRLGGIWALLGRLLWIVPRPLRDLGYDLFARVRHRLVRRPEAACPVLPPQLRGRFDP
ncbi:MAG: DCC1-like thiol-disulfide oxidoreductase family protein [Holophagales bacterium]|nr:DCC1-like thiol-disulfide oxidoreductase family protein [Holophagales bacterium]